MKKYKKINKDRIIKFHDVAKNTIHRSSLLVPEIEGTKVEISFLNHFLIKRKIKDVLCKISAIDNQGNLNGTRSFKIHQPKVYRINLSNLFENGNTYNVEFFSSSDLFIPFTAVIINHIGKNFISQVHAYNRILNDIFEDSVVNEIKVDECCIDINKNQDTFFVFTSGNSNVKEYINMESNIKNILIKSKLAINQKKLTSKKYQLSEVLKEPSKSLWDGHLIVSQPYQKLFFGRLLVAQQYKDGAFSANHSYYDNSKFKEYWDDCSYSYRLYPFLKNFENSINIYPITSPSALDYSIDLFNEDGKIIKSYKIGKLKSPSDIYIKHKIKCDNSNEIVAFGLKAFAKTNKIPTRVTHQLLYGRGKINCSINTSLVNENIFRNLKYVSPTWGEIIIGKKYNSVLCLCAGTIPKDFSIDYKVKLDVFSVDGKVHSKNYTLKGGTSLNINVDNIIDQKYITKDYEYFWYFINSKNHGLSAYTITYNLQSNHCSGEHNFG